MNDLPPPVALAIIVADEVTIDPATGKPTARGIFFNLDTPLPLRFDFSIFVTITEVRRPALLTVKVLDPDDNPLRRGSGSHRRYRGNPRTAGADAGNIRDSGRRPPGGPCDGA